MEKYVVAKMGWNGGIISHECLGHHGKYKVSSLSDDLDIFDTVEEAKEAGFEYFGKGYVFKWCVCEYDPDSRILTGRCHYIHERK